MVSGFIIVADFGLSLQALGGHRPMRQKGRRPQTTATVWIRYRINMQSP